MASPTTAMAMTRNCSIGNKKRVGSSRLVPSIVETTVIRDLQLASHQKCAETVPASWSILWFLCQLELLHSSFIAVSIAIATFMNNYTQSALSLKQSSHTIKCLRGIQGSVVASSDQNKNIATTKQRQPQQTFRWGCGVSPVPPTTENSEHHQPSCIRFGAILA